MSGPILDRIDIQIEVPALTADELLRTLPGEASAVVRERVLEARVRQAARGWLNAMLPNAALREHVVLDPVLQRLVADAMDRGGMSARGVHRALRVARTIADLGRAECVDTRALGEALQYRTHEQRRHLPG